MKETMNQLPMLHELPQDAQSAIKKFIRTENIPNLDRDLNVCIEREYSLTNKITSWVKSFWGAMKR